MALGLLRGLQRTRIAVVLRDLRGVLDSKDGSVCEARDEVDGDRDERVDKSLSLAALLGTL